jgi:creatinine amidohydrolase
MTWPEVAAAAEQGRVALIPVGVTEQHGYHLPTKTDTFLAETVARLAAERVPELAVVVPPIAHGFVPHHMDFPGRSPFEPRSSSTTASTSARRSSRTASESSCS